MAALGVPVTFIAPAAWKRQVGIKPGKEGAKDAARSEAIRRWPAQAALFARAKDEGRAEAALIGAAGITRSKEFAARPTTGTAICPDAGFRVHNL